MAFNINNHKIILQFAAVTLLASGCSTGYKQDAPSTATQVTKNQTVTTKVVKTKPAKEVVKPVDYFGNKLSNAAKERTRHNIVYDGRYVRIGYPWGDVPSNIGVCTDVVVRSYRKLGIDLQQQVHQDMSRNFHAYPNLSKWNLNKPDPNIDHRRVYNLKAFFNRHGVTLPRTQNPAHYQPGDLVTWKLAPGQEHIGIVVNQRSKQDPKRHLIVHNIAEGPKMEDVLFRFPMSGHYRYYGNMRNTGSTLVASRTEPASVSGLGNIPPELLR